MAFNIGIVSQLQIDPKSSASEINKVINSSDFKNQLGAVKISLEASMTQKELASFRKSVRDITSSSFGDNKQPTVKVGVEVNKGQAVKSINSALTQAAKDLKKIRVDIDARVDKNTLKQQLQGDKVDTNSGTRLGVEKQITDEKRKQGVEQDKLSGKQGASTVAQEKIVAQAKAMTAAAKATGNEFLDLNKTFSSSGQMAEELKKQFQSAGHHVQSVETDTIDLKNGMQQAVVQVERYNNELKRTQTLTVRANQSPTGQFAPSSLKQVDNTAKASDQSTQRATTLANNQIAQYEKIIASGTRVEATYKKQIAALRQLANAQNTSAADMRKTISAQQIAIRADEQRAKSIDFQTQLLHKHTKAMQQNQRYINKSGMNTLAKEIQNVNVHSSNALPQLRALQGQMSGYVNQAAQATRSQMGIMENFSNAMLKFPIWMGASTLFFGAIQAARTFITTIVEIDSKMITLQKVMSDSANMDEVFNNATLAAERFGQTISGVLDAYAEFARQGYEGADLTNFGNAALIGSNVGEVSAQEASEYLTAANAQWKTQSDEAMGQVDSWNEIANNYATTVAKLGEGQAKAGSSAKAMGLDFDETNAVIGALTAQTKQSGSEIGNFIKAVFPRAYTVSANVFEELGISLDDANGKTKSAIDLYREAAHAMEGMSQADQADIVRGLGGTHHYQRMQVLLDTLRETDGLYDQILHSSRNSDGSAIAENAIYMESLEAKINKAKVSIEQFSLALGEAFLEAGIIDFLTTFTDFMTLLTKAFTDLSPIMRNLGFGVFIASLAAANGRVRDFYSAIWNLPKALERMRSSMEATAKANQFVASTPMNIMPVSTGTDNNALTKNLAETRRLQDQSTQSAFLLTNAQNGVAKSANTTATATQVLSRTQQSATSFTTAQAVQTQFLTKAQQAGSVAARGLGLALRGLLAATGVGLVIGGITWALEKFVNKSAEASSASNEFAQAQDILKQNLQQDAEGVKGLVTEYERLDAQLKDGTYEVGTEEHVEATERHSEALSKLSGMFPDLVSGSEGYNASLISQKPLMEARIQMLEAQIEREKELAEVQERAARAETIKAARGAEKDLNSPEWSLRGHRTVDSTGERAANKLSVAPSSEDISNIEKMLRQAETLNDLTAAREEMERKRQNLIKTDPELYQSTISAYGTALDYLDGRIVEHSVKQSEAMEGVNAIGMNFLEKMTAMVGSQGRLGEQSMTLFGGLTAQLGAHNAGIDESERALQRLQSTMANDEGFIDKMAGYEQAVQSFYDATDDVTRLEAMKQIQTEFQGIASSIQEVLSSSGMGDEQIQGIISSWEQAQYAALNFKLEADGTVVAMDEAELSADGLSDSVEEMGYSWQKATDSISDFIDEMRALDGEMGVLENAMEKLANGEMDMSGWLDVLEIYPEMINYMDDYDVAMQKLQGRYGEVTDAAIHNYAEQQVAHERAKATETENEQIAQENKLNANADYVEGSSQNEDLLLEGNAERAGVDSDNSYKKEVNKEGHTADRVISDDKKEVEATNAKGEYYTTDNHNFSNMANTKESTEVGLINSLKTKWHNYVAEMSQNIQSFTSWAEGILNSLNIPLIGKKEELNTAPTSSLTSVPSAPDLQLNLEETTRVANAVVDIHEVHRKVEDIKSEIDKGSDDFIKGLENETQAMRDLADAGAGSGKTLGDFGGKAGRAGKSADKAGKDTKKAGDKAEEAAEKVKDLNIEVERQVKTFQKSTFVLNKYEESLRKINVQLEKQNLQTERYATHSANYRKALQNENKLNERKLKVMQQQEKSLANQIKQGKINEYGMVNEDVNVAYNQYSTSTSGEGSKTRKTGTVTPAKSSGKIAPFAGWKVNYGYSPQGGGRYGRQIGFNGGRHYGIDFGGKTGQAIKTPHGGQVVRAGWSNHGGGYQVEVYNKAMDKTFTFMHMLQNLAVKTGQTVQAGQRIGSMGSTGNSTGTHLHFQVNTGRGINNSRSVNPNSYLTSGSSSVVGAGVSAATKNTTNTSTSTSSQLGRNISADMAENLNAREQAELDAIEKRINQYNTGQENKSKVQDAKEDLDQMMLDRLQLIATMRENDFKVIESYVESYDVSQNKLNHKIAQLEYKAEDAARKAGKTTDSDEWRKYMTQAQNERKKQLEFQNQQVSYIQRVLNADAKKSPAQRMNEAYKFQLEETLRDAKEQVVNLRREIDEAETAILASKTNQILNELDDQLAQIDKQLTLIEHKRNFIDSTYADGAKEYISSLKEEMKQHQKRDKHLDDAVKSLKALRGSLRQQPDLYDQVTQKIEEMEGAIRESELAIFNLNKEIKTIEIDKLFERLNENLEKAQKNFNKLNNELHYIRKEGQSDLYFDTQADVLEEMKQYKGTIEDNIKELKKMEKELKDFPELHKRVTDELKNWEEQHITVRKEMHTLRTEFTTDFIASIKQIYQTQKDLANEAIDEEYSEYEKMINKKLKLIDDTATEDRYNEDIADRQEELQKLRDEIAQRSGDDSLANQRRLKELREELKDMEREYTRFVDDKERERRKEALQEELEDAKEIADNKKENTNKMFDDLLNDQRKFNEIQEEIMAGQVDKYKEIYKELTTFVKENVEDIGKSISEGMLDGISTPFEALQELSKLLKEISEDGVPVLESGLKPIEAKTGDTISELIKGVSNNLSLLNLGVSPSLPELNTNNKNTPISTTNNNNTFSSLVNIENFKGTQREKDDLVATLSRELRKLGVIV